MSYTYANNQVIDQHTGGQSASKYFYVNNRLGSVRQVIDMSGSVERNYTYSPFGQLLESGAASGAPSNPFMFTGQWFDDEISQYFLRARMYDPALMRFTARDPVRGSFREPMTLHVYLYCLNDPINKVDPEGRFAYNFVSSILTGGALYAHGIDLATYAASSGNWGFFGLAQATFEFMPVGMAVATVGVRTWVGRGVGLYMGWRIEKLTEITGMDVWKGVLMDTFAYYMYSCWMLNARADSEIRPWDMQDFLEWRD